MMILAFIVVTLVCVPLGFYIGYNFMWVLDGRPRNMALPGMSRWAKR